MVRGSPFTALCRQLAELATPVVADLHAHTTASDGDYTPSQLVALARGARLRALAITDHDAVDGLPPAREAAAGTGLEIVAGVECSAEFAGRELHILGYFVDDADETFRGQLREVQARRRERFLRAVDQLRAGGAAFTPGLVENLAARTPSLGRRHLAGLLVQSGVAAHRGEAFGVHLRALEPPVAPIHLTPSGEVIARIHSAGGIASLAHPPREFALAEFRTLQEMGLDAIEAHCPSTASRAGELVAAAGELGLGVTGGTDTHGPPPVGALRPRRVGDFGLSATDWRALRGRAGTP